MSDMSASERDASRYQKVDVFAMGCTLFFLCVGKELYGATGRRARASAREPRPKRAQATQAAMEEAMDDGGLFSAEPNLRDREAGLEEEMVVRRRRDDRADDAATPPDARDALSFGAAAATLNPMFAAALGRKAAMAEAEAEQSEEDLDMLMLEAMAEFRVRTERRGRTRVRRGELRRTRVPAARAAASRIPRRVVRRKLCPRQPPGFASLVASAERNPEERTHRRGGAQLAGRVGTTRRRRGRDETTREVKIDDGTQSARFALATRADLPPMSRRSKVIRLEHRAVEVHLVFFPGRRSRDAARVRRDRDAIEPGMIRHLHRRTLRFGHPLEIRRGQPPSAYPRPYAFVAGRTGR